MEKTHPQERNARVKRYDTLIGDEWEQRAAVGESRASRFS